MVPYLEAPLTAVFLPVDVIGILASRADAASVGIARELVAVATGERPPSVLDDRYQLDGAELVVVDELHIELTGVDARFETTPAWIAVVSRHAGDTGPLLTVHIPGNIDTAEFGGEPRTVPPACPNAMRAYRHAVAEYAPDGYDVGIECTHHGPTDSDLPIMFVEVGSDEAQWSDEAAATAVARALWSVRTEPANRPLQLVGLGGGHYAPRFERVLTETSWAVGHIAPDWGLESLDTDGLRQVIPGLFDATQTTYCLIDGDHPELGELVDLLGYRVVSERWLRATSRLGEPVVDALEAEFETLGDGLTLGDRRVESPGAVEYIELPQSLLADCDAIDPAATREAVAASTVAYTLDAEGARPDGRFAIVDRADLEAIISALMDILSQKYDDVTRTDGEITVRRRTFNPEAATTLGVPEGPLFGRLAAGESVTVDGRQIDPADVTADHTVTYALPPDV